MKFTLEINMDNAAFEYAAEAELDRLLEKTAAQVRGGLTDGAIFDINGNRVGKFEIHID